MRRSAAILAVLIGAALGLNATPALAAGPPEVVGTWIGSGAVSTSTAVISAKIKPNGVVTGYKLEYVNEAGFLANGFNGAIVLPTTGEAAVGSGTGAVTVARQLTGLQPNAAYRYRITAKSAEGTTVGPTRRLLTDGPAVPFALPDGRAWEMVSPVEKNGGDIPGIGGTLGGGVLQAASAGGAITYSSPTSFGEARGAPGGNQYVSRRGDAGWATQNITQATESGAYGANPDGVPFQLFTPDLGVALVLDGHRCPTAGACPRSYSAWAAASGGFTALPYSEDDLELAGAAPGFGDLAFTTCAALTSDATEVPASGGGCEPSATNLYLRSGATLKLVNLLPGETVGTPGATLAAQANAIAPGGNRVYWSEGGNLYLREGAVTKPLEGTSGGARAFQTAATDGSAAFFIEGGHLYRFLAASGAATDLTPAGTVAGVLGAAEDGSVVYFQTAAGLSIWRAGSGVTAIPASADPSDYPPTTGTARVSPDGLHLAFVSSAETGGYDNRNHATEVLQPEVYVYTAAPGGGAGTLICASCNPSGESPLAPSTIPGASANGKGPAATDAYKPRVLAAGGARLFFDTANALVGEDTNLRTDVYEWDAPGVGGCAASLGCVALISSGRSIEGASFIDASSDGGDAFFLTDGALAAGDPGAIDVYDARIGGGLPVPPAAIDCNGDECQEIPPAPEDPTPGTQRTGGGNPPLATPPAACKKGQVKKQGKCVKKHTKKKKHAKKKGHKKKGGAKR